MEPIRSEFENDPDMMEIVEEFASELPSRALAMEECMASGEMDKLQTLAHQLKGAGGGYGFQPITDTAALLESALKEGADAGTIKDKINDLCEVLNAVVVPETK